MRYRLIVDGASTRWDEPYIAEFETRKEADKELRKWKNMGSGYLSRIEKILEKS